MARRLFNVIREQRNKRYYKIFAFYPVREGKKKKFKIKSEFSFNLVSTESLKRIINDLNIKKASSGEIRTSLFKKGDFVLDTVTVCVNEGLKKGTFSYSLKCTNFRPIYKKEDPFYKRSYIPVSILPLLSKVFKRMMYELASNYFEPFFSMKVCMDLEKHTVRNMLYLNYQLHSKIRFIEVGFLVLF